MIRALVLILAIAVTPPAAISQAVAANTQNVPEKISIAIENESLTDAIWTIARRAGTRVIFDYTKLPKRSITYKAESVTPSEALAAILKGTGFTPSRASNGTFELIPVGSNRNTHLNGVVTGKITDAKSGKGISGASVSFGGDSRGVTTDEGGMYRLANVPAGNITVSARMVGYAKQSRSVTIGEGATVTVDFKLEPSASVLDQVIVTGTVIATELKAVPSAITVVTAKQIEERGITRIDQLFRGDIPGLFAQNQGSNAALDEVTMYSRGVTALSQASAGISTSSNNTTFLTNPIKTYVDGVELADSKYLSQIDPKSIERIEILTGPQASTIYGSNAINGVMQIFTKRGSTPRPQLNLNLLSGWVENNFSDARTPQHDYNAQLSGVEGKISYNAGGTWNYAGPWTPAKQTTRIDGFSGIRIEIPVNSGRVTADMTLRRSNTQNLERGTNQQVVTNYEEAGWYRVSSLKGLSRPTTYNLIGQTLGLTLGYSPTSWWSHELGMGQDASSSEKLYTDAGHVNFLDTTLSYSQTRIERRSMHYTTTARIPVTSMAEATVIAGVDGWQSLVQSVAASPQSLTGTLSGTCCLNRQPSHNTGSFLQTQVGIWDKLFLTYGLRAEWNPNFGEEAEPSYAPRYGVAYTEEMGVFTAKLRTSYGRATRPPDAKRKVAQKATTIYGNVFLPDYGDLDFYLRNPELGPEYQQGVEGGAELYFGNRGSLVVTRYNQTIDGLINSPLVDSVRSLNPNPATSQGALDAQGYGYVYQFQFLNVGSIRNQGWELQGSVNTGPFTTRGTYSWTKSRTIGINSRYRAYFASSPIYQPGATFDFLPEHTWALGTSYVAANTTVSLSVTGAGQLRSTRNAFFLKNLNFGIRLPQNRLNMDQSRYINVNSGYALADLNLSHRLSYRLEGVAQIQNVTDSYTNDYDGDFATIGRQTKVGLRMRF